MTRAWLLSLSLFAIACGPPWKVIRQSGPPSALAGAQIIGVSFDWSRAMLGGRPEQEWLATQPPNDQSSYQEVRSAIMDTFLAVLTQELGSRGISVVASTGAEPIQLVVQPLELQMGFYRFMVAQDSRLATAHVFRVNGEETDHIEVRAVVEATMTNPRILSRMMDCASYTARVVSRYVVEAQ